MGSDWNAPLHHLEAAPFVLGTLTPSAKTESAEQNEPARKDDRTAAT